MKMRLPRNVKYTHNTDKKHIHITQIRKFFKNVCCSSFESLQENDFSPLLEFLQDYSHSLPWFLSLPGRESVERLDLNTRIYMKKRYDKFFERRRRSRGTSLTGNKMLCKKNEWRRRWRRKRREKKKEQPLLHSLLHSSPRFLSFPLTFLLPARKRVCAHAFRSVRVMQDKSCEVSEFQSLPSFFPTFRERERGIERHTKKSLDNFSSWRTCAIFSLAGESVLLQEWGKGKNMKDYRVRRREKHKRIQRIEW